MDYDRPYRGFRPLMLRDLPIGGYEARVPVWESVRFEGRCRGEMTYHRWWRGRGLLRGG